MLQIASVVPCWQHQHCAGSSSSVADPFPRVAGTAAPVTGLSITPPKPRRRPLEFRAVRDSTARRLSRLHALLYRLTGGVVGRRLVRNDMLLLTTRGFATGKPHTVPLLYLHDNDALVVIASWGGRPDNPDWYRNLTREPRATVHVRRKRWAVWARTATVRERALWWPRIVAAYPAYRTYQSRTDRVIPVVFLEPASPLPPQ